MSVRQAVVPCLLVLAAVTFGGCGGDSGDSSDSSASPSAKASVTEPACPEDARCFEFSQGSDGWPEVNDDDHFAGRDSYLDGTYRIGARESGSWSLAAPVKASDLSPNYGVQIDADATLAQSFPEEAAWGATCWTRPLAGGRIAGFAAYVQPGAVTLGLFDENTGAFKPLREHKADGMATPGEKTHVTLRCRQDASSGAAVAKIEVLLNGEPTVSISYANSVKNYSWSPADGLGLLAAGKGADVFYDHVVITGK